MCLDGWRTPFLLPVSVDGSTDARKRRRLAAPKADQRAEPCDNLVTIGAAVRSLAAFLRDFGRLDDGSPPTRASDRLSKVGGGGRPACRSARREAGMGDKRRGAAGGREDPRGAPAHTDGIKR